MKCWISWSYAPATGSRAQNNENPTCGPRKLNFCESVATSNPENVCVAPSINRSHQEKLLQSSRTYLRFCAARDTAVGVDRLAHDRRNLAFRCDASSDYGMDCPATPGSVSVRRRAICCGISVEFGFDFSRGDLGYREVGGTTLAAVTGPHRTAIGTIRRECLHLINVLPAMRDPAGIGCRSRRA